MSNIDNRQPPAEPADHTSSAFHSIPADKYSGEACPICGAALDWDPDEDIAQCSDCGYVVDKRQT